MEYEFLFVVEGVSIDDDEAVSTLTTDFEGLLSWQRGLQRLAVVGEGANVMDALHGLLPRLANSLPDLRLVRLDPDLVGVADIADRTSRSRQNVQQWVDGNRRAETPFPEPEGTVGRSLVWRWAEVNEWLRHIGRDDGELRPTRQDALFVDLVLLQWQQMQASGQPMLRFVAAGDDRAVDRQQVMAGLTQAVSDPQFQARLMALPRDNQHRLAVVCAVLLDPLKFVLGQLGGDQSGVLAVLAEDDTLHVMPIASVELPWSAPISDLGLSDDATVGDLVLALQSAPVSPSTPLVLAWQ